MMEGDIFMARILSHAEIEACIHDLYEVRDRTAEYCEAISRIISLYESDETVQSLFASGSFGQEQYADLKLLEQSVNNYLHELSQQLVPKTAKYLFEQEKLVTGGED